MRVVLLHGFTQTSACWGRFGDALTALADVVALDVPGHGAAADIDLDLAGAADLAVELGGEAVYLGYSMGGRVALHAGLRHPDRVRGLVLLGATAGIDDDDERAARRAADEQLADHLVEVGVERFVDEWLAGPLFARLGPDAACRDARLANTVTGLASSLRSAGTGTMTPLWPVLHRLQMPVLVLAGADDHKFTALGRRLADGIGAASTLSTITGAGHAAHLEAPERTAAEVVAWLVRTGLS